MESRNLIEHTIEPTDLEKYFGIRPDKIEKLEIFGKYIVVIEHMHSKKARPKKPD